MNGEGSVLDNDYLFLNENGHSQARYHLKKLINLAAFVPMKKGSLGTHSLRKGPATYASRCGINKSYVEKRGHWIGPKKTVDPYIAIDLPYPGAKTASVLCGKLGPCKYVLSKNVEIFTSEFLATEICPTVAACTNPEVAKILGLPLIWAAYQKDHGILPKNLRKKILNSIKLAGRHDDENPIERKKFFVLNDQDNVVFMECEEAAENSNASTKKVTPSVDPLLFMSMHHTTQVRIEELRANMEIELKRMRVEMSAIKRSLKRLANQPAKRVVKPRNVYGSLHMNSEDKQKPAKL